MDHKGYTKNGDGPSSLKVVCGPPGRGGEFTEQSKKTALKSLTLSKLLPFLNVRPCTSSDECPPLIRLVWIKSINCGGSIWELDLITSERSPI
jgi:hypothetical protein